EKSELGAIENRIIELQSDYDSLDQPVNVLLPTLGVKLSIPSLTVGRVRIFQATASELELRFGKVGLSIVEPHFLKKPEEQVVIEFSVVAEPNRAIEIAIVEARRVFDILRYAVTFIFPNEYRTFCLNLALVGEMPSESRYAFANDSSANPT